MRRHTRSEPTPARLIARAAWRTEPLLPLRPEPVEIGSWWVGLSRAAFIEEAHSQATRLKVAGLRWPDSRLFDESKLKPRPSAQFYGDLDPL